MIFADRLGEIMVIGIPQALLFFRYETFIKSFFNNLGTEVVYSGPTNQGILEKGIADCVDEACLPMKVFQGHVKKLLNECDKVSVQRIIKCEYGYSICPKFSGLPELIGGGKLKDRFIFSDPLYLDDWSKTKLRLIKSGIKEGICKKEMRDAFEAAEKSYWIGKISDTVKVYEYRTSEKVKVAILGHPYNIYDNYVNMDVEKALCSMGVQVVKVDGLGYRTNEVPPGLLKRPYWRFYKDNLCSAIHIVKSNMADGIIYISSFNCGTDSITISMVKDRIDDFPMLVLKMDEHTAKAGIETRLEAFVELLMRRRQITYYHEAKEERSVWRA